MTVLVVALATAYVIVTVALALGTLGNYWMMVSLLRKEPGVQEWEYERAESARNFVRAPLWPLNLVRMARQAWRDAR